MEGGREGWRESRRLRRGAERYTPVEDDEAVAEPVRGVPAPGHVRADTEGPVKAPADTNADALPEWTSCVAGDDRLGSLSHGVDFTSATGGVGAGAGNENERIAGMISRRTSENGSAALTLLVDAPAPIAVHGHDGAAGRTTAVGARQLRVAVPVKGEVPHRGSLGPVLDGPNEAVRAMSIRHPSGTEKDGMNWGRDALTGCPCTTAEMMSLMCVSKLSRVITDLDVAPPVTALSPRALGEVDLLLRVRGVESILLADRTAVAVERDTSKGARSLLHLFTAYVTVSTHAVRA